MQNYAQYHGIYAYNTYFQIQGNEVINKRYWLDQLRGYSVGKKRNQESGKVRLLSDAEIEIIEEVDEEKPVVEKKVDESVQRERFKKSLYRAVSTIHELVACNVGIHSCPTEKKPTVKFVTLTFQDNVQDIEVANDEFKKFMKRLNYHLFGVKKNLIKYVVVPELQGRGAWHFHMITFNMPYIKRDELIALWGNGIMVGIEVVKGDNGEKYDAGRVANYVTKYLTKGVEVQSDGSLKSKEDGEKNLSDFDLYKALELENMKRYSASRGLKRADKFYVKMDEETYQEVMSVLGHQDMIRTMDKKGKRIKVRHYENKWRGSITHLVVRLKKKKIDSIKWFLFAVVMMIKKKSRTKELFDFELSDYKINIMLERGIINKYTRTIKAEFERIKQNERMGWNRPDHMVSIA